jgi:diadenosine tetraphosphate (Ap4A) HIT family hydrolase
LPGQGNATGDSHAQAGTWPSDWFERKAGRDCPLCAQGRTDADEFGVRIFAGECSDAYLQREAVQPGYVVVVWRGRHAAEPTDLNPQESSLYWAEVLLVARQLARYYNPAQTNYEIHGNTVPHLHTHVLMRYLNDSPPGKPLPWANKGRLPHDQFENDVGQLRRIFEYRPRASAD